MPVRPSGLNPSLVNQDAISAHLNGSFNTPLVLIDASASLQDFEDKLRRAANLHLDPDLNDGVVLNIAPLRELFLWKEAKSY